MGFTNLFSCSRTSNQSPTIGDTANYEVRVRTHILDVCCGTASVVTLAHATLTQFDVPGWTIARIVGVAAAAIFAVCPFLMRAKGRFPIAAGIFVATLLTAATFAALWNGGLTAPTTCFLILAPAMAGLLLGGRAAVAACAASFGALALLSTAPAMGLAHASPHSQAELDQLRLSALAIAVLTATIVVTAYQVDLRRSIRALAESERINARNAKELDLIFNNTPVHLLFKDDRNTILRANRAAAESAGSTTEAMMGASTEAVYPAMAAKYLADDLAVLESGVARLGIIEECTPAAGRRGWVRTDKVPHVDPVTGKRYLFVAAIDITEQRIAELALAESERRFALAAEGSGAGIWDWIDIASEAHFWSPRFFALLGYAPGEIEASTATLRELVHPDDRDSVRAALRGHLNDQAPFLLDLRLRHKSAGSRWYRATGQAIWNEHGAPLRMIGSIIDIDAQKRVEESLLVHARALERSNDALRAFSQAVSHDLRSPLRAFEHLASWTEDDVAAGRIEAARAQLLSMRARATHMGELLEGLRLYALAGSAAETIERVSSRILVEHAFGMLAPPEFRLAIGSELPTFNTAAAPLAQIFRNLIDNAIKHHDRTDGIITVRHEDSGGYWVFEVADNGPGIPAEFQKRIFEMFEVLQRREDQAGAGAGLAIVKKTVEALGGAVSVSSSAPDSRGATFRFLWPKHWPQEGVPHDDIGAGPYASCSTDHRAA